MRIQLILLKRPVRDKNTFPCLKFKPKWISFDSPTYQLLNYQTCMFNQQATVCHDVIYVSEHNYGCINMITKCVYKKKR